MKQQATLELTIQAWPELVIQEPVLRVIQLAPLPPDFSQLSLGGNAQVMNIISTFFQLLLNSR